MSQMRRSLQNFPNDPVVEKILNAGQGHVFDWWQDLTEDERHALLNQIRRIDFGVLEAAFQKIQNPEKEVFLSLRPGQSTLLEGETLLKSQTIGEQAIQNGKICSLVLAGGEGTRLKYRSPKGMYPIGPVSGKSLFQWFAEKIAFTTQRFKALEKLPWIIMTSEATDRQTKSFFQDHGFFGLREENVCFIKQGLLPAFDFSGKLIMDSKYHIYENPDGHGGIIQALGKSGLLDQLTQLGVQHLFVHNIDNCLVHIYDAAFLGYHIDTESDFSCKSLPKRSAEETLGTIVEVDGKVRIIEYSDVPDRIATMEDENGELVFRNGSINTYLLRIDFLRNYYQANCPLPLHCVRKNIGGLNALGYVSDSAKPNAIKLETKIFDLLPHTRRAAVITASRSEEFSPLKSSDGLESYATVYRDLQALFWGWLESAEIHLPADRVGKIEISPLFAVDKHTFLEKVTALGRTAFADMLERQIDENGVISL